MPVVGPGVADLHLKLGRSFRSRLVPKPNLDPQALVWAWPLVIPRNYDGQKSGVISVDAHGSAWFAPACQRAETIARANTPMKRGHIVGPLLGTGWRFYPGKHRTDFE